MSKLIEWIKKVIKWLFSSNRMYHILIGLQAAVVGTIICAVEVAIALEGKDCQYDKKNANLPPWKWSYEHWDWIDFACTVFGGLIGQAVQLAIVIPIIMNH
jgi:hypothetical protein